MFYVSLDGQKLLLNSAINLTVNETRLRYALRSVIYSGGEHFTCRIINANGAVWYHDGIGTGCTSGTEGSIHTKDRCHTASGACLGSVGPLSSRYTIPSVVRSRRWKARARALR
ncbi:hypothetical protein B0H14DRAFT_2351362 [Mycena olivaceomarginata]|nr:hypothetical protein B0H14DRAFT_2351362 [Mycena olivaceomarginata]